ncbi:MAG TPA: glycosyltransferase [Tepidisphaeraceae bacterium]|nr:glycosyltransferase [Tepidisphaeraceae bacterium]
MPGNKSGLNILILNPDLPVFPGRAGHEYLHTTQLARRARHLGLVSLLHTPEQAAKKQSLCDAGVSLYLWESPHAAGNGQPPATSRPPWRQRALETIFLTAKALHPRPPENLIQDLQFCNIAPHLQEAIEADHWQAMVIVQSTCAQWLDYLPQRAAASVLVLHDVRALMLRRKADATRNPMRKLLYLLEAARCRRFEKKYCGKFDLVVTMSDRDEGWVRQHYAPADVAAIPIPVDGQYFKPLPGVDQAAERIVFTGMMDHPPNVDAVRFFARDVLPRIRQERADVEFWIVGRDPPPEVMELAAEPGVVVTGFVADIRSFVARASVVVVPLRFGSGMRNKILEAWAMEKCVVSTTIGAEGLDYRDGQNILIVDTAASLAEKTLAALRDPGLRDAIRRGGRDHVLEAHHPEKLAEKYYSRIEAAVRQKRATPRANRAIIDLRWMHPGVAGGIENLSRSFIQHLAELDAVNQYTLLVPSEVKYDFDLRRSSNFKVRADHGFRAHSRSAINLAKQLSLQWLKVGSSWTQEAQSMRTAAAYRADVALSPSGYIKRDLYPLRNVLLVHDLQHEYLPELFAPAVLEERRRVFGDSIRQAAYILAMSEYTRQTVIEKFAVPPERIKTVYQACDPLFHPANRSGRDKTIVLKKYGLADRQFIFFPAKTWPHKNHKTAVAALARLRDDHGLTPMLVCTAAPEKNQESLYELIAAEKLEQQVRFLGYCPVEDIPSLYEGAAAMVYPSLFEGFGIPLLEAMWCDCPVVCSNVTSLPEIGGDAVCQVNPTSAEEIAAGLQRVLTDTSYRQQLISRGALRARQFSWTDFTVHTVEAMRQVWLG